MNVILGVSSGLLAAVALGSALIWTLIGVEQPTPTTAAALPAPDPSALEWYDVASWESSGNNDSAAFHISADSWRVLWEAPHDSVGNGKFAIHVYNPDGFFVRLLYDTADYPESELDGSLRGSLVVLDSGDYFLRALTSRDYHLTVQELR